MRKLLWLVPMVAALAVGWLFFGEPTRGGQAVFYDRIWIDHLPRDERDAVEILAALRREPVGVFQQTSQWRGRYELFTYEARGDGDAVFTFPHTRDRDRVRYTARRCDESGFDYCLELVGNSRGAKRYYSKKGWEVRTAAELHDLRARL